MGTSERKKTWAVLGLVMGLVVALSIPAVGSANDDGRRHVSESVSAGGDFGRLAASWYSDGNKQMSLSGTNPDGGEYGGAFDCQFWGTREVTMPTYQKRGLDTIHVTLSIDSSEFDYCVGDFPEVVTYDVEFVVDYVEQVVRSDRRMVLKGDGYESKTTSQTTNGSGSGEGLVTGTFQGVAIEGWGYGGFTFGSYLEGGPPTTAMTP